jgi:hypothetical protein
MNNNAHELEIPELARAVFRLYRSNFGLFFGIAMLPAALLTLIELLAAPVEPPRHLIDFCWRFGTGFLGLCLCGLTICSGSAACALSFLRSGYSPTVRSLYSGFFTSAGRVVATASMALARCVIAFFAGWYAWVLLVRINSNFVFKIPIQRSIIDTYEFTTLRWFTLILPLAWAMVSYCRYALAIHACVNEDISASESLVRSRRLTTGHKWPICLAMLLGGIFPLLVSVFALRMSNPMALLGLCLAGFVISSLLNPIPMLTPAVIYDRLRTEAEISKIAEPAGVK